MPDLTGRYVCYCMTRNIYHKIIPSLKSLIKNANPARVYIVAEDDDVGFPLPKQVQVMNWSKQTFFHPDGPNYHNDWTYMALMRTALCHMFPPDMHRILSLDLDTIVNANIDELWEMPLDGYYAAGVKEPSKSDKTPYINAGVVMWNLAKLRDGTADRIIRALNTEKYRFCEQDCLNEICAGKLKPINCTYNATRWTGLPGDPKIRHFAAEPGWYENEPLVRKYRDMAWEDVTECFSG